MSTISIEFLGGPHDGEERDFEGESPPYLIDFVIPDRRVWEWTNDGATPLPSIVPVKKMTYRLKRHSNWAPYLNSSGNYVYEFEGYRT